MKDHYRIWAIGMFLVAMLSVLTIVKISNVNTYATFPLKLNEQHENLTEGFIVNQNGANAITDRFFEYLRKVNGVTHDDSVYTVNGIRAEDFPAYFAGTYINEEGKLVVQITDTYYSSNYKDSDWYKEFTGIVQSEAFYCHSVKYSYGELVNAISEVTLGKLAKRLKTRGVSISIAYIDDYRNQVMVGFGSQSDYDAVIDELDSDIYSVQITDGGIQDATGLHPGEKIIVAATPISVACRVKRNYPDGSSVNGILTCAHGFSGTQTVYVNYAYPIGISYSFNRHYGGNADVGFIETYSDIMLYDIVDSSAVSLYSSYVTSFNQGAVVDLKGSATSGISGGFILNSSFSGSVDGILFTDLVSASYESAQGDSGGIVFIPSNVTNHAYPAGIHKGSYSQDSNQYSAFTKLYNGIAALQSGTITYSLY